MNFYLLAAGALIFVIGLLHSVFGEIMIFNRMRKGGIVPTEGGKPLGEGHVRILWACWHLQTALGWGMSAILIWLALHASQVGSFAFIANAVAASTIAGALFVLVGTQGKHPGWIGLLGVAVLVWFGRLAAG